MNVGFLLASAQQFLLCDPEIAVFVLSSYRGKGLPPAGYSISNSVFLAPWLSLRRGFMQTLTYISLLLHFLLKPLCCHKPDSFHPPYLCLLISPHPICLLRVLIPPPGHSSACVSEVICFLLPIKSLKAYVCHFVSLPSESFPFLSPRWSLPCLLAFSLTSVAFPFFSSNDSL